MSLMKQAGPSTWTVEREHHVDGKRRQALEQDGIDIGFEDIGDRRTVDLMVAGVSLDSEMVDMPTRIQEQAQRIGELTEELLRSQVETERLISEAADLRERLGKTVSGVVTARSKSGELARVARAWKDAANYPRTKKLNFDARVWNSLLDVAESLEAGLDQ